LYFRKTYPRATFQSSFSEQFFGATVQNDSPKKPTARTIMTKEEIVKAIRVCAKNLRRNPNLRELREMAGVPAKHVYKRLGSLRKARKLPGGKALGRDLARRKRQCCGTGPRWRAG
jgi:hypothetical protein